MLFRFLLVISFLASTFPSISQVYDFLDERFAVNGVAEIQDLGYGIPGSVRTDSNENIFYLYRQDSSLIIVRLGQDGLIDSLFAENGLLEIEFESNIKSLIYKIEEDQHYIYACSSIESNLISFDSDGRLNSDFGIDGILKFNSGLKHSANSLVIGDSLIYVLWSSSPFFEYTSYGVNKLFVNGKFDNAFKHNLDTFYYYIPYLRPSITLNEFDELFLFSPVRENLNGFIKHYSEIIKFSVEGNICPEFQNTILQDPLLNFDTMTSGFISVVGSKVQCLRIDSFDLYINRFDYLGNWDRSFAKEGELRIQEDSLFSYSIKSIGENQVLYHRRTHLRTSESLTYRLECRDFNFNLISDFGHMGKIWLDWSYRPFGDISLNNEKGIYLMKTSINDIQFNIKKLRPKENLNSVSKVEAKELFVYPNPTSDQINVQFPFKIGYGSIIIYNSVGEIIKELSDIDFSKDLFQYDFTRFPSGVYYLNLKSTNGFNSTSLLIKN